MKCVQNVRKQQQKMKILYFTLLPINILNEQKLAETCVKISLLITAELGRVVTSHTVNFDWMF